MEKQYFGTDGIRGRVGEGSITPEFMLKLGWAVGKVFKSTTRPCKVLIGKDTRISGYMFESVLEAGLSAAGVDVRLLGPMPTPGIAYLTRTFHADAGIVISASHNPYHDNGIKFFSGEGKKLPDQLEFAIEKQLALPLETVQSAHLGKVKRVEDAAGRYIEFCKSTIERGLNFDRLKVVLDCSNGATYAIAPKVFEELDADVEVIGASPDGLNINLNCGSTDLTNLQAAVVERGADVGVAFDGDGDRVLMVDHTGEIVDGDEILYIMTKDRLQRNALGGGLVGTQMTNFGLEIAMKAMGVEFIRAKVGDRYVLELLQKRGWLLGGESSGHIVCLDLTTTGDGIVSALQLVSFMAKSGKSLAELRAGMQKLPQKMINVKVANGKSVVEKAEIAGAVADIESRLLGKGRVLLRPSGTEPVVRVMVEGDNHDEVEQYAEELAEVVGGAV